jgi:anti-sigma factor RsiW
MTHLEEGTIHAWLDGALGADEAAEVERHFSTCDECAARVAEARGLVAGASRILSALDDVGSEIVPARTPDVTRRPVRPKATRIVAWLAAAGLLLAVGLETRANMGSALAPNGGVRTDASPVKTTDSSMENVKVISAPRASAYGTRAGNAHIEVTVPRPAPAGTSAPAGISAPTSVVAKSGVGVDSATRAARPPAAAKALRLQDVAVTAAESQQPAPALGGGPVCFEELPEAPVPMPMTADAQRGAARAAVGGAAAAGTNETRGRLAANVLMLDTTPASPNATGAQGPRLLRNAGGVAGEWELLGSKGAAGNDSLVLRLGQPMVRAMRVELAPAGLKVGARVMVRVRCPNVPR